MNIRKLIQALFFAIAVLVSTSTSAQEKQNLQAIRLADIAAIQKKKDAETLTLLTSLARQKKWAFTIKGKNGRMAQLVGVDSKGFPLYTETYNTLNAAATIGTNKLWTGGSTGLNVTGGLSALRDKVAIWDGGGVNNTHQELTGRIVAKDAQSGADDHASHVAGIMISKGIVPSSRGMAYDLPSLLTYTFTNHLSEMANEASNLLVSNHSYGSVCGWRYNDSQSRWEWYGQFNTTEDYKFGYYSQEAQFWDSLSYLSPNYLIVQASGNSRNQRGPAVGTNYWRLNANGAMINAGARPDGISSQDGYDNIPTYANSKNILTVGNIIAIPGGYTKPSDVTLNNSSSVGPTDDGRIKPDVVANGTNVTSTVSGGPAAYATLSGTSMSSPSVAGSAVLLQELYIKKNSVPAWSSTIKGAIIHSANRGSANPGPDYLTGWGVPDFGVAGQIINNNNDNLLQQRTLNNNGKYTVSVVASGKSPLKVSICWTDPPGTVETTNLLNDRTKKLIHDLDLRVIRGDRTFFPWKLNPNSPASVATRGDNDLDNVEVIELDSVLVGETYTIEVSHKGSLTRNGTQTFSLVATGVGGKAYASSAPASNAGSRIDSVSIGTITNANTAGCKSYSDFRHRLIPIEIGQSLPFYILTNSCDASNGGRFIKMYIDFNSDGDFDDAGETVATSGSLTNNGTFSGTISIPSTLTIGSVLYARIVLSETNAPTNVLPSGSYSLGETQDYLMTVSLPSTDVAAGSIVYPEFGECANGKKYVTVKVRNSGTAPKGNIPVEIQIRKGTTVVTTLRDTCKQIIAGQSEVEMTIQTPFVMEGNTAYSFVTTVSTPGDQLLSNNTLVSEISTAPPSDAPTNLSGLVCNGTEVKLRANATGNNKIAWFTSETAQIPLANSTSGVLVSSTTLTTNRRYFAATNDFSGRVGPATKMAFPNGGYNEFTGNFVRFNNQIPMVIESVRMYTANPGRITIILADLSSETGTGGYSYFTRDQRVFNVQNSRPTPASGSLSENNPLDTGFVYNLNFEVPDVGNHILIVQCSNGATIYRNNNIPLPGPYPLRMNDSSSVFSITGNSVTSNNGDFNNFYYFFYDMRVRSLDGCPSPRVSFTAPTNVLPVITQNGNTLNSSATTGNQWRLNGNDISGATQQQYNALNSGLYRVAVTDSFSCTGLSNEINLVITALNNIVDPSKISLLLAPNPNNGQFHVQFNVRKRDNLDISVLNITGQQVYRKSYDQFVGDFKETISIPNASPGIYTLKVVHGDNHYLKRMVIQ